MCIKQCANCRYEKKPTKRCACNVTAKHELLNAEPMKYNGEGMQYCDAFRPKRGK